MENLMVLNLDDYHNIHTKRCPDTTTTSEVHHFQTILLKAELPSRKKLATNLLQRELACVNIKTQKILET